MPKKIPIVAWDHIVVRVSDVERSLKFYKEHLGFEPVVDVTIGGPPLAKILSARSGRDLADANARLVMGKVGGQLVELIQYDLPDGEAFDEPRIGAFTLRVADAEEAYEACTERGLSPETEPVDIYGSKQFFIKDPDGISIELTQPPKG